MNKEILNENNIVLNVPSESKIQAIERVGNLLLKMAMSKRIYRRYEKREEDVTTYIGNGIAIPHGVSEYVKYIKNLE